MNKVLPALVFTILVTFTSHQNLLAQEPWNEEQLMEPSELAERINDEDLKAPLIISVSPEGMHGLRPGKGIKGSVEFGASDNPQNLAKLKAALEAHPRDTEIVLYCGCCPFGMCHNIRPAFSLLNEMKFTNHKLLNLKKNIRVDWMNKGYPMN